MKPVTFKNIKIISTETNPVIDIVQSDNLLFDNITYKENAELVFRVSGERAKSIKIKNTGTAALAEKIKEELGAAQSVSIIK